MACHQHVENTFRFKLWKVKLVKKKFHLRRKINGLFELELELAIFPALAYKCGSSLALLQVGRCYYLIGNIFYTILIQLCPSPHVPQLGLYFSF